jgi:hypothetical protein
MQDRTCQIDKNLLHRTAGPYIRVMSLNAMIEHKISAPPPKADMPINSRAAAGFAAR